MKPLRNVWTTPTGVSETAKEFYERVAWGWNCVVIECNCDPTWRPAHYAVEGRDNVAGRKILYDPEE